jgi:hypothetical protein
VNGEPFKYDGHVSDDHARNHENGRYYAAELKYIKHIPICTISADKIPLYVDALGIERYNEKFNRQNAKAD